MNLIYIRIYYNVVSYKGNLKHCFLFLKGSEIHYLLNIYVESLHVDIYYCNRQYLTVTGNDLFCKKSFEEREVQKSLFQDYLKANRIAKGGDYAKISHVNH